MKRRIQDLKRLVFYAARKHKADFFSIANKFEDRGILNSEMLCIVSLCKEMDIEVLIETGRFRGQSTEILAKFFRDTKIEIISIELLIDQNSEYVESKMKKYNNIQLLYGDSAELIPQLVKDHKHQNIGILFDGPKGKTAIEIFKYCLTISDKVGIGCFHDMRKPLGNMPNHSRKYLEKDFSTTFFTDDVKYISEFQSIDNPCRGKFWRPYVLNQNSIGSYGPTVGIVIPDEKDINQARIRKGFLAVEIWFFRINIKIIVFLHLLRKIIKI